MKKIFLGICVLLFTLSISLSTYAESNVSCPTFTRQLSLGSKGADVSLLQKFLREKGFFTYQINTEYFGNLTKKAVIEFQRANSIDPIGVVGPKTRAEIASVCTTTSAQITATTLTAPLKSNNNPQSGLLGLLPLRSGRIVHDRNSTPSDTTPPTVTHTVGGAVSGLTGTGLVLQNSGADDLSISADGSFTFATPVAEDASYDITISEQPSGQTCVVTNNTGTMGGSDVTNISISCTAILVSITVTPSSSNLPTTINEQFTATGHYADSSKADITASVAWDTSDHAVATINSTGLGTGVSAGTAQVSATLDGVTGTTNLTVNDAVLVAITVSPTNSSLPVSINSQIRASGIFSDGSTVDITDQVTWDTTDHSTSTINSTGLAIGVAPGTTQISATLNGITGTTNLTVTTATLVVITITPSNSHLPAGINSQYSASGTFSDASIVDITDQVTWDTSDHAVATINGTGLATGVASGAVEISASLNGVTGTTNLTVTNATLVSVTVLPNNSSLPRGISEQYTAYGIFSDSTTIDITNQATWDTSNHTVATISATGLGIGGNAGTTQVTATLRTVSGSTNLTVTTATLVSIAISPSNPTVARGSTLQLSALGTFSDSSTVDITNQATWTSSSSAIAIVQNTDPRGQVTGVSGGSSVIHVSLNSVTGTATLFAGN